MRASKPESNCLIGSRLDMGVSKKLAFPVKCAESCSSKKRWPKRHRIYADFQYPGSVQGDGSIGAQLPHPSPLRLRLQAVLHSPSLSERSGWLESHRSQFLAAFQGHRSFSNRTRRKTTLHKASLGTYPSYEGRHLEPLGTGQLPAQFITP